MDFSSRTPADLSQNDLTRALGSIDRSCLIDLTISNPTHCDFVYPCELLESLSSDRGRVYEPDPFGHVEAREAVAQNLESKGLRVDPSSILLTSGTSESYSYLFKLLANPGETILVPSPGYPLLEHITQLEGVKALPYRLQMSANWPLERASVAGQFSSRVKGLVAVDPQNPMGCFLSPADINFLEEGCKETGAALIIDEVFSDYAYHEKPPTKISPDVLSFRMGGLSKSLGLPQLKLSWTVFNGPPDILADCRNRLELIADTYLSVGTPVQRALPDLFRFAPLLQNQIKARLSANLLRLESALQAIPGIKLWKAQGGWYALIEVLNREVRDDLLAVRLLKESQVLVQPGVFFDFPSGCFLVLSLLPKLEKFEEGVLRLRKFLEKLKNYKQG